MNILKKLLPFIVILIFSFFAYKPLLNTGFFPIHDDTQVARVYQMSNALRDGMIPVRWVSDLGYGYGYPIFNFYDPLPYYMGGIIGLVSDALFATKLVMILGIVFAGFFMYLLAKEFWGELGGILSALFYVYAPYHAVNIYVRGDIAEFWAYAFIPVAFYGLWKIHKEESWKSVIIFSLSYAAIILSHNLTAIIVSPFIFCFVIYCVYRNRKYKRILFFSAPLFIGILLSAFYWIPAIYEINYTNVFSIIGGGSDFRNNFVCLSQLWTSPWGYGGSVAGCIDGVSFMIGKYHIILTFVSIIFLVFILRLKKFSKLFGKDKEKVVIIFLAFLGFLVSVFFTLEISKGVWEFIKPMVFLQYPWRFLSMIVFFSSFICGSLLYFLQRFFKNRQANYLLGILVFVIFIFLSVKFFVPQSILNKTSKDYTNEFSLKWTTSKISDEYMPRNFQKPQNPYQIPDISNLLTKDLRVKIVKKSTQEINLNLDVINSGNYILPIAYFPSWNAYLDGKKVDLIESQKGMSIRLPKGNHSLLIKFQQTNIELLGNISSITGILILFAGIIYLKPKHE